MLKLPHYVKCSRHFNFAIFSIKKNSQAKIKCREINMTRKLSDPPYVNNQKSDFVTIAHVYNNHFLTILR